MVCSRWGTAWKSRIAPAIGDVLDGTRAWDPEAHPDLLKFLRSVVDSKVSHLVREVENRQRWLALVTEYAPKNYDLAVEILGARRLVKGYSDTHARGESKFDRVIGAVPLLAPRADGADWMRRLRDAALMDENGIALDGALKTVATL